VASATTKGLALRAVPLAVLRDPVRIAVIEDRELSLFGSEQEFVKTPGKMGFSTIDVFRLNSAECETTISQKS
jgi:hypothetical protein